MVNRKKPTNKELLDMNIWLRERLDMTIKFSQDTAMVLNTYIKMKGDEKALFREIRKTQENEIKNKSIKENVMKGIKNESEKKGQTTQTNR